jgi:hypothetical protein
MTYTEPDHGRAVKTSLPDYARNPGMQPLATFLGLFSVGLGLAELLTPKAVERVSGVHSRGLLRMYGLREVASGLGILRTDRPAFWLWARVAGDVVDLATLAAAYADGNLVDRPRAVQAALAVAGVTALDVACAVEHSRNPDYRGTAA